MEPGRNIHNPTEHLKPGNKVLFYPMRHDFLKNIAFWKVPRRRFFVRLVRVIADKKNMMHSQTNISLCSFVHHQT
jgi:hypothetical protein